MLDPAIRMAEAADVPVLAALRRARAAENGDDAADEGFEARFADWYERESARRIGAHGVGVLGGAGAPLEATMDRIGAFGWSMPAGHHPSHPWHHPEQRIWPALGSPPRPRKGGGLGS